MATQNELAEAHRTCVCGTGSHEVIVKSRATGRCCDYYAVASVSGSNVSLTPGAVYQLVGGTYQDKPTLIRINAGGTASVLYAGVYSVKPTSNIFKNIATNVTVTDFTPVWTPVTLSS
jgi:hypothetical protein